MTYTHARKKDANHGVIVAALKAVGAFVIDLSDVGGGVPDLLVARGGHLSLIEIKNVDGRGKRRAKGEIPNAEHLSDEQITWLSEYGMSGPPVRVVTNAEEALAVVVPTEADVQRALEGLNATAIEPTPSKEPPDAR